VKFFEQDLQIAKRLKNSKKIEVEDTEKKSPMFFMENDASMVLSSKGDLFDE